MAMAEDKAYLIGMAIIAVVAIAYYIYQRHGKSGFMSPLMYGATSEAVNISIANGDRDLALQRTYF